MSLRQIAKELGVSHTLLVLWLQGKRNLAPNLEARYHQLVTSGYTHGYNSRRNSERLVEDSASEFGDPPGTRTQNLRIKSPLLYQIELAGQTSRRAPETQLSWRTPTAD